MSLKGVFYTDGGCRSNHGSSTGKIGWGVHGYLYKDTSIKPVSANDHILTSVGYIHKNKPEPPDTVYIEPINYIDGLGSSLDAATNNVAELSGIIQVIIKANELSVADLYIITDSEYVKKGINEWMFNWSRNNWTKADGQPIANSDLWKQLHNLLTDLKSRNINYTVDWIRAHDDNQGNVQADLLASVGCNYSFDQLLINQFRISDAKKYWKPEVERHPFINFKRIYFNSFQRFNVPGHYYQADPGGNDMIIGKRLPDTGYSVIRLHEPDLVIETVKDMQHRIARGYNGIFMMKLENTHHKDIYPYIQDYNHYALRKFRKNNNLVFIDDVNTPITTEINPTGLSLRAISSFNFLEELLDKYVHYNKTQEDPYTDIFKLQLIDITETFFNEVEKKSVVSKELKPEIGVGFKDLKVVVERDGKNIGLPLVLGVDLPPRNSLKKLERLQPRITLVTYTESEQSLRYATIIDCENAIGIWSNYYASRVLL